MLTILSLSTLSVDEHKNQDSDLSQLQFRFLFLLSLHLQHAVNFISQNVLQKMIS